jgi:hypothetical protein
MNANSNISINPNFPQYEDFCAEIDGKLILSSSSIIHSWMGISLLCIR